MNKRLTIFNKEYGYNEKQGYKTSARNKLEIKGTIEDLKKCIDKRIENITYNMNSQIINLRNNISQQTSSLNNLVQSFMYEQVNFSNFHYNISTQTWSYITLTSYFDTFFKGSIFHFDLNTQNKILIYECIKDSKILSLTFDNEVGKINMYRYFQPGETLLELIKQTIEDYYTITDVSDNDINSILNHTNNDYSFGNGPYIINYIKNSYSIDVEDISINFKNKDYIIISRNNVELMDTMFYNKMLKDYCKKRLYIIGSDYTIPNLTLFNNWLLFDSTPGSCSKFVYQFAGNGGKKMQSV